MEKSELKIVVKYYFLQGMGYRSIYKEINTALPETDISLSSVKRWCKKFSSGDLSCNDLSRSGRPKINVADQIREMLEEQPFLSAKYIASELGHSPTAIKSVLINDLGLKKYRRRWIPHMLSEDDKEKRVEYSKEILKELIKARKNFFNTIMTGDESWFFYEYEHKEMYAESRDMVPPIVSKKIQSKKTMFTIFFNGTKMLCIDALPSNYKFNQQYFIDYIIPQFHENVDHDKKQPPLKNIKIHMDNSPIHNGSLVAQKLKEEKINRIPHPPYSPDLSPCDFWFFGMAKENLKGVEINSEEDLENEIIRIFDGVTFEELQMVFEAWIKRLEWVIKNHGEYYHK